MIITKQTLSRREMLRAAGAAIALPFLDSMIPAFGGSRGRSGHGGPPSRAWSTCRTG